MADHDLDPAAFEAALRAMGRLPPRSPLPLDPLLLTLVPREDGLQEKAVPVEQLGQKLVSMRNKLRVLEQRVNASQVSLDEKVRLQAQITRTYDAFSAFMAFFSEDALPLHGLPPHDAPTGPNTGAAKPSEEASS